MNVTFGKLHNQNKSEPMSESLKPQDGVGSDCELAENGTTTATNSTDTLDSGTAISKLAAETKPGMEPELLDPDRFQDAVDEIENLKVEATAMAKVHELSDEQGFNYFQLGGVLKVIRENGWYAGHQTFAELCVEEFNFGPRKAEYFIQIYNFLLEACVTWEQVKGVGWSKMRVIAGLDDPKAAIPWIEKAGTATVKELQEEVKSYVASQHAGTEQVPAKVESKTFKLHADQKETLDTALDKAMKETGSNVETVNLDHICMVYMSPGASTLKAKKDQEAADVPPLVTLEESLRAVLKEYDNDQDATQKVVFEVFEKVFPDLNVQVNLPE